jgi:uncharacterized protein (TIGR02246 family)
MSTVIRALPLIATLTVAACTTPPPAPPAQPAPPADTRAADEATIRAAIRDWSAAAKAKDAAKFVSFYAPDAVLMIEDAPDMRGIEALRTGVTAMMQDPNFALSFEADTVVVARSSDVAYETGTYAMTMTGPHKKPATENGHYVVVWQKQADNTWKVVRDNPVSDPPVTAGPAGR